jgi:ribosomal protein L40E
MNKKKQIKPKSNLDNPKLKFCVECGAKIREKAEICPKCGVRQPLFAHQKSSTQQDDAEGKSQMVALILTIFIGWLGIDRFYLGLIGTGILKLLTISYALSRSKRPEGVVSVTNIQ